MHLAIRLFEPAPKPLEIPTNAKNRGVTKPTAARDSGPNPATQIPSIMLFRVMNKLLIIIGNANLFIAFLGWFTIKSISSVLFCAIAHLTIYWPGFMKSSKNSSLAISSISINL